MDLKLILLIASLISPCKYFPVACIISPIILNLVFSISTVADNEKFTFFFVKTIVMLHNNSCNTTNLCSCHFYKMIVFMLSTSILHLSTFFLQLLYKPHCTWFKQLALLCGSIKPSFCRLPSRKNHSYYTKLQAFLKNNM